MKIIVKLLHVRAVKVVSGKRLGYWLFIVVLLGKLYIFSVALIDIMALFGVLYRDSLI